MKKPKVLIFDNEKITFLLTKYLLGGKIDLTLVHTTSQATNFLRLNGIENIELIVISCSNGSMDLIKHVHKKDKHKFLVLSDFDDEPIKHKNNFLSWSDFNCQKREFVRAGGKLKSTRKHLSQKIIEILNL
ncbi:MAG: hypothetical protein U9O55_00895 [Patescibacteria group bacterium]|nr:hypothetical protein [Patescibacteria group bacterium]